MSPLRHCNNVHLYDFNNNNNCRSPTTPNIISLAT